MKEKSEDRMEVLIAIVDYSLGNRLKNLYKKQELPFYFLSHGYGSVESEIYELLGFGSPKKMLALSIQCARMTPHLLTELQERIAFHRPGTGIAFTLPVDSISRSLWNLCRRADTDREHREVETEDRTMELKNPYDLIVTIVDRGHSDLVMNAAKAAGATGGTLLHGLGLGSKEAEKFLGISIQPEKDVILILTPQEKKPRIMKRITQEAGLNTPGRGICFSLPVNAALGLVSQN